MYLLWIALLLAAGILAAGATPKLPREPAGLRPGQKVLVDDGSCPNGKIKEVTGAFAQQPAAGATAAAADGRIRRCVSR